MKKIFSFLMLAAALVVVSCSQPELGNDVLPVGQEVEVTFSADMAQLGTRAGEGSKVDVVYFAAYHAGTNTLLGISNVEEGVEVVNGKATINTTLVVGKTYDFVFWAENEAANHYSIDWNARKLTVTYGTEANDETRDAFMYVENGYEVTPDNVNNTFTLKRPFAQVNVGSSDADEAGMQASGITITSSALTTTAYTTLDLSSEEATVDGKTTVTFTDNALLNEKLAANGEADGYLYLAMNYLLVNQKEYLGEVTLTFNNGEYTRSYKEVPVQRNYRTNILGTIITDPAKFEVELKPGFEPDKYDIIDGLVHVTVTNTEEFNEAFEEFQQGKIDVIVLGGDIVLGTTSRATVDPQVLVKSGETLTIDLNGNTLSATSAQTTKNYDMIDVRGTLTVKNGTITTAHVGENMGWNRSTNVFNVTAGGVLNLEGVTAQNLGGSDMAFVAHLNNWGEVTLNATDCVLESTYVAVRVFNSGNDMNNVTIKNSTLTGANNCFWVHNYTAEDFGSQEKADAHKALLNLNIYGQGNTFSPDVNGVRYGFTNSVRTDARGITKTVSEDGSVVTLGSLVEDGLIRRSVAGTEGNTTVKKVVVGEGVTTLYDRTFRQYKALETVELPSTLTTIGAAGTGVFQSCSSLKSIVLPESVTTLGVGTFYGCTSLTSVNIPSGVTRIEENCLRETGLTSIEFHAGVTYFGAQAFRDCKQLKEVIINAPSFTIVPNAFGIMSGALPGTTIYVANAEMKAYLESTMTYASQFTVIAPSVVDSAEALTEALANGENVVLSGDVAMDAATTAPYGNKYAVKLDGGVIDGGGNKLHMESYGDDYGIMTSGGTVKNITIEEGCRAIMIMYPTSDVVLDNVNIGGDGVLYPINTGEAGSDDVNLIVTNSVLAGWTSFSNIKSASFTNVEFKQGTYYNNIYGRVLKPYVNTTLTNCSFVKSMNLDLSGLAEGCKVVVKNCKVDGQALTAEVCTIPSTDAQYDTELFTVDLPSWATSVNDCVAFE